MSTATYRFEMAVSGRALCQNSECKKNGVKIQKLEFRMGTLVIYEEHASWKWKHWGCVTPLQIRNLQDQVGPLEDLDLDSDLPHIIDGYDEISSESQDKIKFAIQNGHVADEDWRGLPEKNRPGQKGINKRTPKKKANPEEQDGGSDAADVETPSKPKAKKSRAKPKVEPDQDIDEAAPSPPPKKVRSRKRKVDEDAEDPQVEPPKVKAASRKRKAVKSDTEDEVMPMATTSRGRKVKAKAAMKAEVDYDQEEPAAVAKPKASRAKKVKAELERDVKPESDVDENADHAASKPKRARASKKVKAESGSGVNVEASVEDENHAPVAAKPKRARAGRKVKPEPDVKPDPEDEEPFPTIETAASVAKPEIKDEMDIEAADPYAAPVKDESPEQDEEEKPATPKKKTAKGKGKAKSKAKAKAK